MSNSLKTVGTAAAIVALLLVAGCAPAEVAAPVSTSSPSPSPTATPVEEPAVGPTTVFDGDCARLFTVGEASAVIGVQAALAGPMYEAGDLAIRQLGGIHCVWRDPAQAAGSLISLAVLPSRVRESGEASCDPDYFCAFFATASGFDLYGFVGDDAASEAVLLDRIATSTAAFTAAVASEKVPEPYAPVGAWPTPIDCSALDPHRVIATALGEPEVVGSEVGGDAEPNAGFYVSYRSAGAIRCGWFATFSAIDTQILPGGAWVAEELAALDGAEPVTVAGVESALQVGKVLHVFDGGNWISLTAFDDERYVDPAVLEAAAGEIVAALAAER